MRVDFPKKSNVLVQKQKCGISNDVFSCGSGAAEIQVTVYCAKLRNFKSQTVRSRTAELGDIVYSLCGSETMELKSQNILCAEAELRDLKSKLLYGSGTAKTSSRTKFIVWKRNCVTSKPQYFPCAEAELRHFSTPSHTIFCMRKRNCRTLSLSIFLVRRRNFKPKNIPCVEAELQNFKSYNSLCAEAKLYILFWSF